MKNYLIIGASSGIGNALAKSLGRQGHMVFGTYRNNTIESHGDHLKAHYLDVMDESPDFGFLPESLDGLAYCPGSIALKPFHRITPDSFISDFALQVAGAVKVIQAALPALKASGNASILLFSTVAVQTGFNFHSQIAASKGAIEGLARALAAELAPGIRVNCIAPSLTDTPLAASLLNTETKKESNAQRHPLKRIGTPDDMASMAEFLLAGHGTWITGQVLHVDGGISTIRT